MSLAEAGRDAGCFVVAKDCGKPVNPPIVDGQVNGAGIAANTVSPGLVETDYDEE